MRKLRPMILLGLCLSVISCGEYELLEHQKDCKRKADSTYKAELKVLAQINDSLCDLTYDKYYQLALDSLIPARKKEIKNLITK